MDLKVCSSLEGFLCSLFEVEYIHHWTPYRNVLRDFKYANNYRNA